jgi:hypothetical protein
MTLSNVRIRDEPLLVTSLRPLAAAPSSTAEPLYSANNEASKVSGVFRACFSTSAFAFLFEMLL